MIIQNKKDKLIQKLGGYTKSDVSILLHYKGIKCYWKGKQQQTNYLCAKTDELYGVDKQDWIDAMYKILDDEDKANHARYLQSIGNYRKTYRRIYDRCLDYER